MPIRDYNFVTGAESATQPTAGTPTDASDLTTKSYVDTAVATINTLANGKIYLGDGSNVAQEVTPTGDVTISNTGVTAIGSGVIINDDIHAAAAIERSKLASGSAGHVIINDGGGVFSSEATLAKSRGGAAADMSSVTFPSSGTITTNAGAQTLTDKTLTDPIISDAVRLSEQGSTPSTPAAGYKKFYAKNDGKVYTLNSSGAEAEVGSGAGGGGINYFSSNPDAEINTTGWTTYDDAAATPVDLTGGTFGGTFARTTTTPLRGGGSFLYTPGTTGEGVAYTITPDLADYGNVLEFSFDYDFISATGATGDYTVWIYDVTNSQLIQPAGYQVAGATVGIYGKFKCTFQTSMTGVTYRIAIHQTTATSAAIEFDNVYCGPQSKSYGPFMSDPVAYTPTTQGFGTITSVDVYYERRGKNLRVFGRFTTGTVAASEAQIGLPAGLTVSSDEGSNIKRVGYLDRSNGSVAYTLVPILATPGDAFVNLGGWMTAGTASGTPIHTPQNGSTLMNNTELEVFEFEVPITGWSSGQLLSSDADTRVVAARYTGTTTAGPASLTPSVIPCVTKVVDTHSAYNTTTGLYTCPVAGVYDVTFQTHSSVAAGTATNAFDIAIYKNGSSIASKYVTSYITSAAERSPSITATVSCNAGDTIGGYLGQNLSGGTIALSNSVRTYIDIKRLSGPSQIAASESVNARYVSTAGQSITTAGSPKIIDYGTKDFDSHGNVTTGAFWKFTASTPGKYNINATAALAGAITWSAGEYGELSIYKNGSRVSNFYMPAEAGHSNAKQIAIQDTLSLVAGDYIDIRIYQTTGDTATLLNTSPYTYVSITRVGN